MDDQSAKGRLLDAVIEHFTVDGLGDQSLRQIASAVGSSHRMLLYHFGSKDGLLVEVAQAVEARTRQQFAGISERLGDQTDEVVRQMWELVADPALGDFERLFFALFGRGLQGEEGIRPLLKENIEGWIAANVELGSELGIPDDVMRVHARLGLAVSRGLLMDLLATGDRQGVDAAMEVFAAGYAGRWWEGQSVGAGKSTVS
jgi:AcrR family transcriptional regulator